MCQLQLARGLGLKSVGTERAVCAALRVPPGTLPHHNLLPTGGDQQSQHRSILSAHNLGPILLVAGLFCAVGLTTLYITTLFSRLLMTVSEQPSRRCFPLAPQTLGVDLT